MYYLSCVSGILFSDKLSRYTNYSQYYFVPDYELPEIASLARLFNPQIMIKSGLFIIEDNLDIGNRFLEITGETIGIHANQEVVMGGLVVKVLKIMLCTNNRLTKNYFNPLDYINKILNPPPQPFIPFGGSYYNDNNIIDEICCCNIF